MAKYEAGRLSIVQGIMLTSTDFLRRIMAPAGEDKEVSRCRICAQTATVFSWKTACGGFQQGRSTAAGCAICGENMIGERPTSCWWCKQATVPVRPRCSKAHAVPQGLCENLINALKLLANQQKDGDSPVQSLVTSLCDRSRKSIMEP